MNGLLEKLLTLPELRELAAEVHKTRCCAAVTGLSPVHRAMVAAALAEETKRPLLLLCADEKECTRQAADVQVLLGVEPVRLPERELQLRPASYSRQWENARLSALYRMAQGDAPVVVATPAAMVQRCLPRETLLHAAFSLEVGGQYDVAALCSRLIAGGYTRTEQVEGAGQFALRGGILDVFSPGEERPLRCEFFDDELDSMGEFEVATQRRVLNRQRAHILPAGELLPFAGETTAADAAERMEEAAGRLKKEHAAARQRLLDDAELLRQGIVPPGADRYMAAVYPDKTTAFDYLGADCVICANEAGRVQEAVRGFLFRWSASPCSSWRACPPAATCCRRACCWISAPSSWRDTAAVWIPPPRTSPTISPPEAAYWCCAAARCGAGTCRNFCSGGIYRRRWRWTEALSRRRDRC